MQLVALPLSVALAVLPYLVATNGQSSTSSLSSSSSSPSLSSSSSNSISGSQTPSPSPSASSESPGGAGGGGGGSPSPSTFQLQDYLTFLTQSGYTSFSSAIEQASHTLDGQEWLGELANGTWTVFVPTNEAFSSVPQTVSSDQTVLADYLSYHYVYGDLGGGTQVPPPNTNGTTTAGGGSPPSGSASTSPTPSSTQSSSSPVTLESFFNRIFGRQQSGGGGPSTQNGQPPPTGGQPQSLRNVISATYPNNTVGRTLLSTPRFVRLEGDKRQALAWTRFTSDGNVTILNQMSPSNQNVTVGNSTVWRNLLVVEVNGVFVPPGNLSAALTAAAASQNDDDDDSNSSSFVQFANEVQFPDSGANNNVSGLQALERATGFTLFAPTSEALLMAGGSVNQSLENLRREDFGEFVNVFRNHYINGTTVYSPSLQMVAANSSSGNQDENDDDDNDNTCFTSSAGEPFTFLSNSTGLFVSVGNDTSARIVQPDVLVENGVVHFIDRVLYQRDGDDDAAGRAFSSYGVKATQSGSDTSVLVFPEPTTGSVVTGSAQSSQTESQAQSQTQSASTITMTTSAEAGGGGSTSSVFRFRRALEA